MSKFNLNKTVLGTALAVAMVAGTASAATITYGSTTKAPHAFEVTNLTSGSGATANPLANRTGTVIYTAETGDALIGQTQALNVRLTFTGANCGAAPTPTSTQVNAVVSAISCTPGANVLMFTLTPGTALTAGEIFTIPSGTLAVAAATALNTVGGSVQISVDVREQAGSQNPIQGSVSSTLLTATQSSTVTFASSGTTIASVASGKTDFITTGTDTFIDKNNVKLGKITLASNPNTVSALGSGAVFTDNGSAGDFKFDTVGTLSVAQSARDRLAVEVNFTDSTGFSQVTLQSAECSVGTTTQNNAAGSLAVLTKATNKYTGSIDLNTAAGESFNVCGRTNGTDAIANQTVTIAANLDLLTGRDTALTAAATGGIIGFDGISTDVFAFNPAKNASIVSFLRITNPSTTTGNVTITGICDDGTKGTDSSFSLTAGHSILLTSSNIENGGNTLTPGLGACVDTNATPANKYRLNVTGEFPKMMVQNFTRNVTTAGTVLSNTNIKD